MLLRAHADVQHTTVRTVEGIIAEIALGADEDDGCLGAIACIICSKLRSPLALGVGEAGAGNEGEAQEEDVAGWIAQRSKVIVVLLTGGILREGKEARAWGEGKRQGPSRVTLTACRQTSQLTQRSRCTTVPCTITFAL
jgi:hypothetical protein